MNNSKIVWYLHHYAGSPGLGMSHRPYYLTKAFNELGHKAYVIAASFHHLLNEGRDVFVEPVTQETVEGVPYLWLKTPRYRGNRLGRLANMFGYAAQLACQAKRLVQITQKPDVLIVSSPHLFHYWPARRLAKKYQARLIFEVRDIWPLTLTEVLGVSKKHPLVLMMHAIERFAYKSADTVVSLLRESLTHMQAKGLDAHRFVYIPNGALVVEAERQIKDDHFFPDVARAKQAGKFLIGYAGAHGVPNALDDLLAALWELQRVGHHGIHVFLLGEGGEKAHLIQKASGLHNVTFLDRVVKDKVAVFLAQMDVVYIGFKKTKLYQYGVSPNKLFEYMLAGKPIIQALASASDLVTEAQCGVTIPPENPQALAEALLAMAKLPGDELQALGEKGRAYVLAHHDYQQLAKRYIKLF